jgi:hypothetical protein
LGEIERRVFWADAMGLEARRSEKRRRKEREKKSKQRSR